MKAVRAFPHSTRSVKEARTFAVEHLLDVDPDTRETIVLLVSELATNAVRHAASAFKVSLDHSGDDIHVGVTDSGDGTPLMGVFDATHPSGRGLQLVDKLSDQWGIDNGPLPSKTVWFTVHVNAFAHGTA